MRVYNTPQGKFLCRMDLACKKILDDFWFYSIEDLESIIDIIRSGCGDEFASDFGKLLQDYNDFTEESMTDAVCYNSENEDDSENADDSDTDYDLCELESRLEAVETKMTQINKLCKSASGLLAILSFGQKSKFGDILKDLKEIEKLSETL